MAMEQSATSSGAGGVNVSLDRLLSPLPCAEGIADAMPSHDRAMARGASNITGSTNVTSLKHASASSTSSVKRGRPNGENILEPQPASQKRKTRRYRGTLACEECRTRKRRCDGNLPACGGCIKRSCACVYSSEAQTRAWQNSALIESLRARLEEFERSQAALLPPPVTQSDSKGDETQPTSTSALREKTSKTCNNSSPDHSGRTHSYEDDSLPLPLSGAVTSPLVDDFSKRDDVAGDCEAAQTVDGRLDLLQGDDLEQQPSGVTKLMRPIQQVLDHISSNRSSSSPSSENPAAARSEPRQARMINCRCNRSVDTATWCLPLRRHADALVRLYFTRCDRLYPIIHQETFMQQYATLWEPEHVDLGIQNPPCSGLCRQTTHGKMFPAMVQMIFAIGSLFETTSPNQNAHRAKVFFLRTQKLDLFDILDDDVGIELVQVGLLMAFYLQSTEKFSKCWNLLGLTIRMAQNMGLQLSMNEARRRGLLRPHATQMECEMRLRIWHGCIVLDREISMSFGRPLMISTPTRTTGLPQAIDDSLLSNEVGVWNTQPEGTPSLIEGYIQLIRLYDILGQILEREASGYTTPVDQGTSTATKAGKTDIQALLSLDSLLTDWRKSLPRHLQYDLNVDKTTDAQSVAPTSSSTIEIGFDIQAKRLYQRFLHVRMLLLQPALETLFKKQHSHQGNDLRDSMEAKFQDIIFSGVAAQCLYSAQLLVQIVDQSTRAGTLPAWWHNICHLYSSGALILMGQFCTLPYPDVFLEPLSETWKVCLQSLSQYVELSIVAKKSFHLLQNSLNRLSPNKCIILDPRSSYPASSETNHLTNLGFHQHNSLPSKSNNQNVATMREDFHALDKLLTPSTHALQIMSGAELLVVTDNNDNNAILAASFSPQHRNDDSKNLSSSRNLMPVIAGGAEPNKSLSDFVDNCGDEISGDSYLMSMPFFSELENLPFDLDGFTNMTHMPLFSGCEDLPPGHRAD